MHSLWGIIGGYQKEFHLSHEDVLWKESWINLQLKVIDSIRRTRKAPKKYDSIEELADFIKISK